MKTGRSWVNHLDIRK